MSIKPEYNVRVVVEDNQILQQLCGMHNAHLKLIEEGLNVHIAHRGNALTITGSITMVETAREVLAGLHHRLRNNQPVDEAEVSAAMRMVSASDNPAQPSLGYDDDRLVIPTKLKRISPRSPIQTAFIKAMRQNSLVFALGPAGTGKTYLAVAQAVSWLLEGRVDRIVLSRPAVEAGERLGFLPGDLKEKVDPYLRPIYDALNDMLPADQVERRLSSGEIEIAPLAFMRGRTLAHSFVILDEAQNTTPVQMKMLLTRLGEKSRMVITGDLTQIDLPPNQSSGLDQAVYRLQHIPDIAFVEFSEADVVRHPIVAKIISAYAAHDAKKKRHTSQD